MKNTVSFLLILTMLLALMAGCGTTSQTPSQSQDVPSAESVSEPEMAPAEASSAVESVYEEPAEEASAAETSLSEEYAAEEPAAEKLDYTLPLFEDTFALEIFWPKPEGPDSSATLLTEEYPFWVTAMDKLNVNVTFIRADSAGAAEKYNLMVASGDMSDVVIQGRNSTYNTGLDAAVADEVYVDLTGYVEDYAPNYAYYLATDEEIAKEIYTQDGKVVVFSGIYDKPTGVSQGLLVNKTNLDDTGLSNSDVVEDWIEIFRAMQANGVPHPAATTPTGNCGNNAFYYAYGTTGASTFMVDLADNSVYYDPTSQNFRDYVEFFAQMYSEGIIDPDFYNTFGMEYFLDGTYGTWMGNYQDLTTMPANWGLEVMAVAPLHLADSTTREPKTTDYSAFIQMTTGVNGACITTSCENVEDTMRFFDWFYSDAGLDAVNYGFEEGVSYETLPDGSHQLLPEMLDRDPVTFLAGRGLYTMFEGWGFFVSDVQLAVESPDAVAANNLWSSADPEKAENMAVPSLASLTEEESVTAARILSDIDTYFNTTLMRWYTCEEPLNDDTWNSFTNNVENMGIDQVVEIYQNAYDRYQTK